MSTVVKGKLKIIFMGTPEFAIPSLAILLKNGYDIVGVITAVDKMGGRGRKETLQSAVKKFALEQGLNVLQPRNLKSAKFQKRLKALAADLQVVVAFRMLPEAVWDMPPLGTVNLHASLLPSYRGAAPINWAIINGEQETGLTTFFLQHEIDTGDLLFQERVTINSSATAGDLHDTMMDVGAELVLKTVVAIEANEITPLPQAHDQATKAPKLFKETCEIDFVQPGQSVYNFIRGLSPWPGAWTTLDGHVLKIYQCRLSEEKSLEPCQIAKQERNLVIGTNDQDIIIEELQLQGRKRLKSSDFLNGYQIQNSFVETTVSAKD